MKLKPNMPSMKEAVLWSEAVLGATELWRLILGAGPFPFGAPALCKNDGFSLSLVIFVTQSLKIYVGTIYRIRNYMQY